MCNWITLLYTLKLTSYCKSTILSWWLSGKESACQFRRLEFNPRVRKSPWRRKWQPTPVFLPRKSNGQRILVGYVPSIGSQRVVHDWVTVTFASLTDPAHPLLCSAILGINQVSIGVGVFLGSVFSSSVLAKFHLLFLLCL